jgi:hypothetical protein
MWQTGKVILAADERVLKIAGQCEGVQSRAGQH